MEMVRSMMVMLMPLEDKISNDDDDYLAIMP